jgi:hypothetical protein
MGATRGDGSIPQTPRSTYRKCKTTISDVPKEFIAGLSAAPDASMMHVLKGFPLSIGKRRVLSMGYRWAQQRR